MNRSQALADTLPQRGGAVFARMGRNVLWLLGGRGFQAVASLLYLGLAARTLGLHGFGLFSVMLAYGQAIANLAEFQPWQVVIRYGMLHRTRGEQGRLGRLLGLTSMLDLAGALTGALVAGLGVLVAGRWLGWSAGEEQCAAWFGMALLLSIGTTPTAMLRLVDRFDLTTYAQAVGPAVRVIGSLIGWLTHADVGLFLIVWAAAALLQHGATWIAALTMTDLPVVVGRRAAAQAVRENPGFWGFMLMTNASASIGLFTEQLATLAIGGAVGVAAAGGFRIAAKIARALAKPVQMTARILYPELARLHAADDHETIDHVFKRANRVSIGLAVAVVAIAILAGPLLIRALAGADFAFAHRLLVILAIGVALDLSGLALEPWLTAHGRADKVLVIRLCGALSFGAVLLALLGPLGASAAAVATAVASLVMRIMLGRGVARLAGS